MLDDGTAAIELHVDGDIRVVEYFAVGHREAGARLDRDRTSTLRVPSTPTTFDRAREGPRRGVDDHRRGLGVPPEAAVPAGQYQLEVSASGGDAVGA